MLVPLKVKESSIKELPTKPIQVNSAIRLPHIRNQHVSTHVDVHKTKNEEQQYINNLSSGVRQDYKHVLPNGESVDIDLCIDVQKSKDGKSYQDTNFAGYVSKESMGYIQGSDRQNMKLSKKFFDDLGMNTLLQSLDIEDISNYEGFELDLYINRKKTDEHGFMADLRLKRSEKRVDDDIVSASFGITDSNVNKRIEADLDYIEVSSEHESRLGITLQAEFMHSLKNIALRSGKSKVHTDLEATLSTGPYLWNECGHYIHEDSRKDYIETIEKKMEDTRVYDSIFKRKQPLFSKEEYNTLATSNNFKDYEAAFMKTGDTAYIKEKLKIMCQNLPGIEKEYKNHLWYLQDLVSKGSFRCTFDFDVKDTPTTNKQLMYLNSKYVQAFGKKMNW